MSAPKPINVLEQRVNHEWQNQKATVMALFNDPTLSWNDVRQQDPLLAKAVLPYMITLAPLSEQTRSNIAIIHETYQELKTKGLHEPTYQFGPELRTITLLEANLCSAPLISMTELSHIAAPLQRRNHSTVHVDIFSYTETLFANIGIDPYNLFDNTPEIQALHAQIKQHCVQHYDWPAEHIQLPLHKGESVEHRCRINALESFMNTRLDSEYHDTYSDYLLQELMPDAVNGSTHTLYPVEDPFTLNGQTINHHELIQWANSDKTTFLETGKNLNVPPATLRYGIRGPLFDIITLEQLSTSYYETVAQYVMTALRQYAFNLTTKLLFNQLTQSFNLKDLPSIQCEFAW